MQIAEKKKREAHSTVFKYSHSHFFLELQKCGQGANFMLESSFGQSFMKTSYALTSKLLARQTVNKSLLSVDARKQQNLLLQLRFQLNCMEGEVGVNRITLKEQVKTLWIHVRITMCNPINYGFCTPLCYCLLEYYYQT